MKDITGLDLEIDSIVVTMVPGYKMLVIGTIVGFTPKKVRVAYKNHNGVDVVITRFPEEIVIPHAYANSY